jgi:hypothetical protein
MNYVQFNPEKHSISKYTKFYSRSQNGLNFVELKNMIGIDYSTKNVILNNRVFPNNISFNSLWIEE